MALCRKNYDIGVLRVISITESNGQQNPLKLWIVVIEQVYRKNVYRSILMRKELSNADI